MYKKTGCKSGYHESGGNCVKDCTANACSGYSLSSCPTGGNCTSCSKQTTTCTGGGTVYKLYSCKSGYTMSGNTCKKGCTPTSCIGFSLSMCPPHGYCSSCTQRDANCNIIAVKHKLFACQPGYNQVGNTCASQSCGITQCEAVCTRNGVGLSYCQAQCRANPCAYQ